MALVDLQTAREHLRIDHTADDADILLKLEAASAAVISYLKLPTGTWDLDVISELDSGAGTGGSTGGESDSGDEAPWDVKAAVLLVLGDFYKNREGTPITNEVAMGYLSPAVTALLHRRRDPALA